MNYNKLSTESKKIIKFLQTEKFDVKHKLNKNSLKIIKKYYNLITELYYPYCKSNTVVSKTLYKKEDYEISQMLNENVFARDLLKVENKFNFTNYNLVYLNEVDNCKVEVNLFCDCLDKNLHELINKIVCVSLTLNNLTNNKNYLRLNLCLLKTKRELPAKFKILGPEEINGGSTYRNSGEVECWRLQELFKVMIHEMVHSLFNDIDYINDSQINKFFKSFCIGSTTLIPNEAYTEFQARLFNIIIIHFKHQKKFNPELLTNLIELEHLFSIIQTAKLLNFYGFKNINQFIKNDKCHKLYTQNSGIFSYVIITSALLSNINTFLSYADTNKLFLNKNKHIFDVDYIIDLFIKSINKKSFTKNVNHILDNLHLINKNKFMKSTFRMTCLELK